MFSLIGVLNALIRTGAILYVFSRAKVLHDLDCVYLADSRCLRCSLRVLAVLVLFILNIEKH